MFVQIEEDGLLLNSPLTAMEDTGGNQNGPHRFGSGSGAKCAKQRIWQSDADKKPTLLLDYGTMDSLSQATRKRPMNTKRFAGMIGMLAAVALGVLGVDHWTKNAKAQQTITPMQVAANEPRPSTPTGTNSTIHFQVAPVDGPPAPVVIPKESAPPPLLSTGELEKKLKESIEKLERALPSLPSGEESASPPPVAPLPALPDPPKPNTDLPPAPISKNADTQVPSTPVIPSPTSGERTKNPETPKLPALPDVDATEKDKSAPGIAPAAAPPPRVVSVPLKINEEAPRPLSPSVAPQVNSGASGDTVPMKIAVPMSEPAPLRNVSANVASQEDFQKRLTDLEMKHLKEIVAELAQRMQEMPQGEERRKVELDHTRHSERLTRLMKAAETIARRANDLTGKSVDGDSPWTMHVETVGGKTVLQAIVHRKARFKVTCDRLDLQTPRGTLLAVGQVQIAGEGFMGACERLSIPLHDDRLILEGNAQVGVRTQPMAIVSEGKESLPPLVTEPRRQDESGSSTVPVLHLKGDYLDLRWNDLMSAPGSARIDELQPTTIRATPGPMVKVAYNSPARDEKWSAWGTLLAMPAEKNGSRQYVIQTREGQILAFVRAPANLSLHDYIGKRVSVFGASTREEGRSAPTFSVSHVAWE